MSVQLRRSVVVGIDGSRDGLLALDWAVAQAGRRGWVVRGIHVLDDHRPLQPLGGADGVDDGTDVLEDAADELARLGFTDATLEIQHGHPAEVLLETSGEALLLVIGRRGAGGFAELIVGSTSQVCAALARAALVVVPDTWKPSEGERGLVVVGVDGSDSGQTALGFAFEAASERGAELIVAHVTDAPESFPRPDLWRLVGGALAGWPDKYPDVLFRSHLRRGHPVQVLAELSQYADLLVVGGHGRSEFTPLRLGSVSRGLVHHTACPVAIVHSEVTG
jgi:nucleotide-binding universal stress UspA family protein